MDTLMMTPTEEENVDILVVVDTFTRYSWLFKLKTYEAEEVVDCLLNIRIIWHL